jgi:hypothetical protein
MRPLAIGWGDNGLGSPGADGACDPIEWLLRAGRVSEISGSASSGKASLALAACARVIASGQVAAWIDTGLGFYPLSFVEAGADPHRLLCIRTGSGRAGLKAADLLLSGGGGQGGERVRLAVLELPAGEKPSFNQVARLERLALHGGTSLLIVDERPASEPALAPVVHTRLLARRDPDGAIHLKVLRGAWGHGSGRSAPGAVLPVSPARADWTRFPVKIAARP